MSYYISQEDGLPVYSRGTTLRATCDVTIRATVTVEYSPNADDLSEIVERAIQDGEFDDAWLEDFEVEDEEEVVE